MSDFGLRIWGLGFGASSFGFQVSGLWFGLRASCFRFRVSDLPQKALRGGSLENLLI